MNYKPIILLTFANQLDGYLAQLKQESQAINAALSNLHDNNCIEVYREQNTTADTLYAAIMRFRERITILHYAGHADGERLYFEDNSGDALGIAGLLGQLPNLQLVFLNGCATFNQVNYLFEKGIKAVIATSIPIDDAKAVEFSSKFYQALGAYNNIKGAFQSAVAFMQTKYGGQFTAQISSREELSYINHKAEMPWGLYFNTQAGADALNWSCPIQKIDIGVNQIDRANYRINEAIIGIMEKMMEYEPTLGNSVLDDQGYYKDNREVFLHIVEQLPCPIGQQIRILGTQDNNMNKASIERLEQIISTYVVSFQFVYYTLLAQIWEHKRQLQQPNIFNNHAQIGYITQNEYYFFDYGQYILQAAQELKSLDIPFLIREFGDFLNEFEVIDSEVQRAHQFLHSLRLRINNKDNTIEQDITTLCIDAEYALAIILESLAFLVKYELVTIRDIKVLNFKYESTSYEHFMWRLNAKVADIASVQTTQSRTFQSFINNASVILTSNIQDLNTYLNLSPFIIDKNAYGMGITEDKATEQQLFMYAYREQSEFKYFTTVHNIYKAKDRPIDQFITSEGDSNSENEERGRSRFMNRSRPSVSNARNSNKPSPFAILRNQFNTFEKDFSF